MTYLYDNQGWLVRLEKNELLIQQLTQLVKDQNITGAWVSGLGGAQWAELRFFNLTRKVYQWKRIDELMEITSLQGNIAWEEDKPLIHLHATLSDATMHAVGGHVKELAVGGTCELYLTSWLSGTLMRQQDDTTGLKLLNI